MAKKQDRQGVRTPSDVERKYNLQAQADAVKAANNAQKTAEKASKDVSALNAALTQEELVKRITNSGENPALYLEEGQLYINAAYLKGVVAALVVDALKVGTLEIGSDAPKALSWSDNGDGTYTLIGTQEVNSHAD